MIKVSIWNFKFQILKLSIKYCKIHLRKSKKRIMIGYPFFYGNEKLIQKDFILLGQDENFIKFSVDPVTENEKLKLIQASTLPIVVEPYKLSLGDEFSYKFCDHISKVCGTCSVIHKTQTVVLDYDSFCTFVNNSDTIISTLASDLKITEQSVTEQIQEFFYKKDVIVQPKGLQRTFYKVGSYLQSAGSAGFVANNIALAKLGGVQGLQILSVQPYLAIAIPTTGAIFLYGCGAIAGNSTLGKICITGGDIFALPMKGVEIMWNTYGNSVIQKVFGIPLVLNMTQTFKTGPGYTIKEIIQYISIDNKSLAKDITTKIKNKLMDWLS